MPLPVQPKNLNEALEWAGSLLNLVPHMMQQTQSMNPPSNPYVINRTKSTMKSTSGMTPTDPRKRVSVPPPPPPPPPPLPSMFPPAPPPLPPTLPPTSVAPQMATLVPSTPDKYRSSLIPNLDYNLTDKTRYRTWKIMLLDELQVRGLVDVIDSNAPKPSNLSELDTEIRKAAVRLNIMSRLDRQFQLIVENIREPLEMIKALDTEIMPISSNLKEVLFQQLGDFKYDPSRMKISEFIRKLEELFWRNEEAGNPWPESRRKSLLLYKVRDVTKEPELLNKLNAEEASYHNIKKWLLDEEALKREKASTADTGAFLSNINRKRLNSRTHCSRCKKRGLRLSNVTQEFLNALINTQGMNDLTRVIEMINHQISFRIGLRGATEAIINLIRDEKVLIRIIEVRTQIDIVLLIGTTKVATRGAAQTQTQTQTFQRKQKHTTLQINQ